jgi:class 3 adenylate cyclase
MGCVSSSTRNSFEARSVWQRFEPVRLLGYGASSQVYVAIDKQVEVRRFVPCTLLLILLI